MTDGGLITSALLPLVQAFTLPTRLLTASHQNRSPFYNVLYLTAQENMRVAMERADWEEQQRVRR